MTQAIALARRSIAHHSKSFALAARLLGREVRDDASVVYAWCRRADDAVDLRPPSEQPAAVTALRRELDSIYGGEAQSDLTLSAFQEVTARRAMPRVYAEELLNGMAMDAAGWAYPDQAMLLAYAFRVAGTVGLMMSHVMGVRHARALRHAAHLGIAMQITNVCRDVREDWGRGRLYLPADMLAHAGAPGLAQALGGELPHEARGPVASVVRALLARAAAFYASGDEGIPLLSRRCAVAVRTARLVYADIGRVILARGADPFADRAVVGTARKLSLAVVALVHTVTAVPSHFEPAPLRGAIELRDVIPV